MEPAGPGSVQDSTLTLPPQISQGGKSRDRGLPFTTQLKITFWSWNPRPPASRGYKRLPSHPIGASLRKQPRASQVRQPSYTPSPRKLSFHGCLQNKRIFILTHTALLWSLLVRLYYSVNEWERLNPGNGVPLLWALPKYLAIPGHLLISTLTGLAELVF